MVRPALVYTLLVLVPAGLLAFFAFGTTDREYEESLTDYHAHLQAEAEAYAQRLEASISDGYRQAENVFCGVEDTLSVHGRPWDGDVVGFVERGRWVGFSPEPPPLEERLEGEPLELLRRVMPGGDLARMETTAPSRALEIFEERLEALPPGELRDLLTYRAAELARQAGQKERAGEHYHQLLGSMASRNLEGLPLSLLASLKLFELFPRDASRARDVRKILSIQHAALPTDFLEELVRRFFPGDLQFTELILRRRQLEKALPENRAILEQEDAILAGQKLLLGRRLLFSQGRILPRAIYLSALEVPSFPGTGLEIRVKPRDATSADLTEQERREAGPTLVTRPVRLRERGLTVAQIFLWDAGHRERLLALATERNFNRLLVGLLVVMSLGGGLFLVIYLVKERRLAQLRARLLANVSHELKTPVTSIRMFSEMLAEDPLDEARTRRFGGLLLAESLRLSRIITNLLDFSWYQKAGGKLPLEPVEVVSAVDRVVDAFTIHAADCGAELDWNRQVEGEAGGKNLVIQSSAGALERILVNFVDNALKYRSERDPRITVRVRRVGDRVEISVRDNGKGIPGKDREKVFEEFYRVDYEDYAIKGAGLGLSICRSLAEKLGGDIRVESKLGVGSDFILSLPVGAEAPDAGGLSVSESHSQEVES